MTNRKTWLWLSMLALAFPTVNASAYDTFPASGGTATTVNAGAGAQTDPHVDGDLVTYTSSVGAGIRYFDFSTGLDLAIPSAPPGNDFLSDVSGSTVVFTRVEGATSTIWSFDTATDGPAVQLAPLATYARRGARVGGTTVAWQDLSFTTGPQVVSEIVTHDLASGVTTRLTDDLLVDKSVSVSPDGGVIVWEKCATSVDPCDIWQATRTPGGWNVSQVTSPSDHGYFPVTNGKLVVYGANRPGNATGSDIYWKPVAGGAEVQLALPGEQKAPSISGNVIAFEGMDLADATPNWDVYLLDLATATIYRVTSTPDLDETLSDISVVGTRARLVWSVVEAGDSNVRAYTFDLCVALGGDADGDGICEARDSCPGTAAGAPVDAQGCSAAQLDTDGDGVPNTADACPNTPAGASVDASGCSASQRDTDHDGVVDSADLCPGTAAGAVVDANGCSAAQRDTDHDGVVDSIDACPGTPTGTVVDAVGCPIPPTARVCDTDHDGDVDWRDILAIVKALGRTASGPTDPRDPNRNGRIDLADVAFCTAGCDRWLCRSP